MALEKMGLEAKLTFNADEAIKNMNSAAASFRSTTAAAKGMTAASSKAASVGGGAGKTKDPYANFGKGLSTGFYRIGEGARNFAFAMSPVTLAMGQGIKSGIEYETRLAELGAITGASKNELGGLASQAANLGYEFGALPADVVKSTLELSKLGVQNKDLGTVLPVTMRAMRAEGMSLTDATSSLGYATTVFGRSWGESGDTLDTMQAVANASAASIVSLGQSLSKGAGSAARFGYDFQETVSVLGLLSSAGQKGTKAGTGLMNMLDSLSGRSKQAKEKLAELGLSVQPDKITGKMPKIVDWVRDWQTKLLKAGGTKEGYTDLVDMIFGKQGARAFDALSKTTDDALANMQKVIDDRAGLAQRIAEKRMQTTQAQYERFASALSSVNNEVWMGIKRTFVEGLPQVSEKIFGVAKALARMREMREWGFVDVGLLKAQFGSATVDIAMGVQDTIEWIRNGIISLGDTISEIGTKFEGAFAGGRRAFVGTLGKTAVGAAVLPMVAVFVWAISSTIVPLFTGLWAVAKSIFPKIGTYFLALGPKLGGFVARFVPFLGWILLFWNVLKPVFNLIWEMVKGLWELLSPILGAVLQIFEMIDDVMSTLGDAFGLLLSQFIELGSMVGGKNSWLMAGFKYFGIGLVMIFGGVALAIQLVIDTLVALLQTLKLGLVKIMAFSTGLMLPIVGKLMGLTPEEMKESRKTLEQMNKEIDKDYGAGFSKVGDDISKQSDKFVSRIEKAMGESTEKNVEPTKTRVVEMEDMGLDLQIKNENTTNTITKFGNKEVAQSITKHEEEILERMGKKPWRRGIVLGAMPDMTG